MFKVQRIFLQRFWYKNTNKRIRKKSRKVRIVFLHLQKSGIINIVSKAQEIGIIWDLCILASRKLWMIFQNMIITVKNRGVKMELHPLKKVMIATNIFES